MEPSFFAMGLMPMGSFDGVFAATEDPVPEQGGTIPNHPEPDREDEEESIVAADDGPEGIPEIPPRV